MPAHATSTRRPNDLESIEEVPVSLFVDGKKQIAFRGESLLTALIALGQKTIARTDEGVPTGAYCGMGICYVCQMIIDGCLERACMTPVHEGMRVETRNHHSIGEEK